MTLQELSNIMADRATNILVQNHDAIIKQFAENVDKSKPLDEICGEMIAKSFTLSVQVSVQISVWLLHELSLIDPDDYSAAKEVPNLTLLKSDD